MYMTLYLNKSVKKIGIVREILPNSNSVKTSKVQDLGAVKKYWAHPWLALTSEFVPGGEVIGMIY